MIIGDILNSHISGLLAGVSSLAVCHCDARPDHG